MMMCCMLGLALGVHAQESVFLQQYREKVKAYNQDIKSAGYAVSIRQEAEKSAKADFLPSLSGNANASYTGNPLELYGELPSIETPLYFQGRDTKYGASVTLLQPVYSGGALKAGLEKSRKEKESALYEEKRVTNDVLYQADQYYWNKVACEEMVEVAAGFKESVAALVEVVRHRVEEEYTDRNDLLMAEVKLNDAEFRLEQARNEAEVARLSMNSFSGEASDKVILTDSLVVPLTEVQVYEQTLETAMAHRPELRIAANQVAIQQSAARIANSRYLPKLSVGVDGSYSSPGYDFNSDLDPNYMVYAKLSVPIFEWGKRKNTRRIGKLDVNRALENQSKVADGVRLEVETAYYTYTQAVRQVCLTESSLAKAATSEQLDGRVFFRVNRQFILSADSIRNIQHYFNGKAVVSVWPAYEGTIQISRERMTLLKMWLNS